MGRRRIVGGAALLLLAVPAMGVAQRAPGDSLAAIAVADSALVAITRGDPRALSDLMVDQAMTYSIRERDGRPVLSSRTRAETRAREINGVIERGFAPWAFLSGRLAVVWMPYDLYVNGQWSHCGVDAFTLVRVEAGWRITSMAWSVDQPPVCQRHPDGPPRR